MKPSVLLLIIVGLVGCGVGPIDPDGGTDGGALWPEGTLELGGEDAGAFTMFPAELQAIPGAQGGFHVGVMYRVTGKALAGVKFEHRVTRVRRRRRGPDFRVEDRLLVDVVSTQRLKTAADLRKLLPATLPAKFTTGDLALHAAIPRWLAQKMAYCLKKTGAIDVVGKQGNAWIYATPRRSRRAA